MEEKNLEESALLDETVSSLEQCMDDLLNTRDMGIYLDTLLTVQNKYLLIMSVQDTPGVLMPNDIFDKLIKLGFSNFIREHLRTYIGVIDRGKVLSDFHNEKEAMPIEYSTDIGDIHISVKSEPYKKGSAEIVINGENYSLNSRGINIVVFDVENKKVVDSSTYDSWLPKAPFYHKNLEFDDSYFDKHVFVPEKYKSIWRDPLKRKFYSNRKLSIREIKDGIVLPLKTIDGKSCGGACDSDFNFVSGYYNFSQDGYKNDRCCMNGYIPSEEQIKEINETVIYGGIVNNHPGHLILESSQLWYLAKNSDPSLRVAVIVRWNSEKSFFNEIMDAFGFPLDKIIVITSPTRFKKLLIPDYSQMMYLYCTPYEFTNDYVNFFEHIKNNITPSPLKKIYLTKIKSRKTFVGEEYFIDFYKKHGFEIIDPEDYSMGEKAQFMLGADEVVSTVGTNNMFLIFCKPTVKVTILTRMDNDSYGGVIANMMCEVIRCKNIYMVNVAAGFFHKNYTGGLNLLCVTNEFKQYVKEVFNEKVDITPEESLKNVLYDYLKVIPEYYSNRIYYNGIKNQKMLTVLQNMSELFLGKDFDTSKLDLSTNESNLQNQVKDLTAQKNTLTSKNELLTKENSELKETVNKLKEEKIEDQSPRKNIELLEFIQTELKNINAEADKYNKEKLLIKAEIDLLRSEKDNLHEELGKLTFENNSLKDRYTQISEEKSTLYEKILLVAREKDDLISELRDLISKLNNNAPVENLNQLTQLQTQQLMQRIKELQDDKDKLSVEIGKINCENDHLKEKLRQSFEQHEALFDAHKALQTEYQSIQSERDKLQGEAARANEAAELAESSISAANQEIERLKDKLYQMENSRSWRYTRIFRKKPSDE